MENLKLENYVVAFLDVLGQRDRLRSMTKLPDSPEEEAQTMSVIKATMGTVLGFRKMRDAYLDELNVKRSVQDGASPSLRGLAESDSIVTGYSLSDAMVFAVPIGEDNGPHASLSSLLSVMLVSCGFMRVHECLACNGVST